MAPNNPRFSRRFLTILMLVCAIAILILSRTGPQQEEIPADSSQQQTEPADNE